ncbi:MAG: hypothetical protein PVJ38_02910, partial [Candidatus Bathyarchaeota archaeon]
MLNDILKIIQLIDNLSFDCERVTIQEERLMLLYQKSFNNGISHFFLTKINDLIYEFKYNKLINIYEEYKNREKYYTKAFKRILKFMFLHDINYVIFKTLKPYPFMGSSYDIDLLILNISKYKLKKILNLLKNKNYVIKSMGVNHIALHDVIYDINIDIYINPSYADMIYLDKNKLRFPNKIDMYGIKTNVLT